MHQVFAGGSAFLTQYRPHTVTVDGFFRLQIAVKHFGKGSIKVNQRNQRVICLFPVFTFPGDNKRYSVTAFINITLIAFVDITGEMPLSFHIFDAYISSTAIVRSKYDDGVIQLFILLQCFYNLAHHVVYHDYKITIGTDAGFTLKFFRRQYRCVGSSNRQI